MGCFYSKIFLKKIIFLVCLVKFWLSLFCNSFRATWCIIFNHKDWCINDRKSLFQRASKCTRIYGLLRTKGQLFSKCLIGVFISSKKRTKIQPNYYGTSSRIVFVRFLGELKTPKRHFEINWTFNSVMYFFSLIEESLFYEFPICFTSFQ